MLPLIVAAYFAAELYMFRIHVPRGAGRFGEQLAIDREDDHMEWIEPAGAVLVMCGKDRGPPRWLDR
jgi:hypothetical protein